MKTIVITIIGDARGYFMETYNCNNFVAMEIVYKFVEDKQIALKGVFCGLHFQKEFQQDKLVRVIKGEVFRRI